MTDLHKKDLNTAEEASGPVTLTNLIVGGMYVLCQGRPHCGGVLGAAHQRGNPNFREPTQVVFSGHETPKAAIGLDRNESAVTRALGMIFLSRDLFYKDLSAITCV